MFGPSIVGVCVERPAMLAARMTASFKIEKLVFVREREPLGYAVVGKVRICALEDLQIH
jgi:hypothetical protein